MRLVNPTRLSRSAVRGISVKPERVTNSGNAYIVFSSGGQARMKIYCLSTGKYFGKRGNFISALLNRISENRYAIQMFFRSGGQINGNVIDTGGISGIVNDFNADKDLKHDFRAVFFSEVDAAFSPGTGFSNSTFLRGGRG